MANDKGKDKFDKFRDGEISSKELISQVQQENQEAVLRVENKRWWKILTGKSWDYSNDESSQSPD